jgi:diguanylate cyclase (GGDEF)-like protein
MSYAEIRQTGVEITSLVLSAVLSALAVVLLLARVINGVIVNYRSRSESDSLTGLLNHQAFHQLGRVPSKDGGSVIFCDIDHFKLINDRFGHLAGDKALCAFANLLRASGYQAGRIGGEEFGVIVPRLSGDAAMIVADRVRKKFGNLRHADMPTEQRISASFGVAEYGPGQSPQSAFIRADAALYEAKRAGRDSVITANASSKLDGEAA